LRGELGWLLLGPANQLTEISQSLGTLAEKLTDNLLELNFGNAVGFFSAPFLGRVEIVSGKWGGDQYDRMLIELSETAASLPFAARMTTALPYDRSAIAHEAVLYHSFVYLRYVLSAKAPFHEQLLPTLRVVLNDPHRLFSRVRRDVETFSARSVDARTLLVAATGRHKLVKASAELRLVPLALALGGHMPERVNEGQVEVTFDTSENRFIKSFLRGAGAIISRMREVVLKADRSDAFSRRMLEQCDELENQLRPINRDMFWRQIGTMTKLPSSSTVIQRRRGYRDVFRHFLRLRLSSKVILLRDLIRDLLEAKDVAQLYELWSFFRVSRAIEAVIGRPAKIGKPRTDDLAVSLPWEFEIEWPQGVRLTFNPRFSRKDEGRRFAYSLPLRPDMALEIESGPNAGLHLFDAKFKVDRLEETLSEAEADDEALEDIRDERRGKFKRVDLYKMHTYRDSIRAARSVWVLYPGQVFRFFSTDGAHLANDRDLSSSLIEGVGAIPLQPLVDEGPELHTVLTLLLSDSRSSYPETWT
jgi:predicted component of viral defense system (DUF524 family)